MGAVLPEDLRAARLRIVSGGRLQREEYLRLIANHIKVLPATSLANGLAYPTLGVAYVRAGLPPVAWRFVARHELEHLLDPDAPEWRVNYRALIAHPVGCIVTIVLSLQRGWLLRRQLGTRREVLSEAWRNFVTYFIPAPERQTPAPRPVKERLKPE